MATPSLADRFQAVTAVQKQEEFRHLSFEQLSEMRVAFGESKVNQRFVDVIQQDPKYVQWFVRKFAESKKAAHLPFLYFVELYTERLELTQETPRENKGEAPKYVGAKAKSKAAARNIIDLDSHGSWSESEPSEPSKPWSVVQEEQHVIQEELSAQRTKISSIETSLSQITAQLQQLTQLAMQSQRA